MIPRQACVLCILVASASFPARAADSDDEAGKLKVAVMDMRTSENIPKEMTAILTTVVSEELDKMGAFKSISSQDIKQMLGFERQKALLGCESDTSCLAEIGGALGADFLVTGSVTLLEGTYLIQLQLMRIAESKVENRVSREYKGGPMGLTKDMRVATQLLVRDILAKRSGQIMITASEEGATVKVDDAIVGVTPLEKPLTVAQGMHTIVVEKEGFVRFSRDVAVQKDQGSFVDARLRPSQEFIESYRTTAGRWRLGAWVSSGVGVAGIGAAVVAFAMGSDKASKLSKDIESYNEQAVRSISELDGIKSREREVATLDSVTLVTGLIGIAALTAGIVTFVTGPDPERYGAETSVQVEPEGSGGSASQGSIDLSITPVGLMLRGTF